MNRLSVAVIALLFLAGFIRTPVTAQNDSIKKVTFKASDGLKVTADFYRAVPEDHTDYSSRPLILMFHMARSSRGEYRKIAPYFVKLGYHCLAIDLRSGERSDRTPKVINETAKRARNQGKKMNYFSAYKDMEAALSWVKKNKFSGTTLAWGSSYSAALVFKLGADHFQQVDVIISFSPGEFIKGHSVKKWVKKTKGIPTYIACGSKAREKNNAKPLFKAVGSRRRFHQANGTHGSYILLDEADNIEPLKKFLKPYTP